MGVGFPTGSFLSSCQTIVAICPQSHAIAAQSRAEDGRISSIYFPIQSRKMRGGMCFIKSGRHIFL